MGCPYFHSHALFKDKPDALQIMLYCDDVNVTDTASPRPVSLTYIYFSLGNIHPRFKSSLDFIHLVIAVEADHLKGHPLRMNEILEPLISDLKKLENGVIINGNVVYGAVVAFLGDNLAQHKVGGFKEGFTATHPCRYCMTSLTDLRNMTQEEVGLLRTSLQYDDQVEQLNNTENNGPLFKNLSESFGLNRGSVLNSLNFLSM